MSDRGAAREPAGVTRAILVLARWAPSGDNTQPWRFEVADDDHVVVHAFDTRRDCVYDIDGQASQVSVGALLETMRIAASVHGLAARVTRRAEAPDEQPVFDVRFVADRAVAVDPLHAHVAGRCVQRRPLATRPLAPAAKAELERAVGDGYAVRWFEPLGERIRWARRAAQNAQIRLTIPGAYAVHRSVIAWGERFSDDRLPDQALGASALSLRSMRWAMASWPRVQRMNRWLGGTLAPRLELDLLPGVLCGAHVAIVARQPPRGIDDHVATGAAVQRFWLTATRLGLQFQPQYTPLVFAAYARRGAAFTADRRAIARAERVRRALDALLGDAATSTVFLGRLGHGAPATARSLRLSLERLAWREDEGSRAP
jgi:nitroreductase